MGGPAFNPPNSPISLGQAGAAGAKSATTTGQNLLSTLYGPNGSGGGTLSQFQNPSSLNINSPTGPYALQYQQAKAQGATATDQAKQAIDRTAGQQGFGAGAPAGYTGFLKNQADLSNAGNNGQLFSQYAGKSYQDALDNFWKATNATNATAGQQSLGGLSAYSQLYGTSQKAATDANGQSKGIVKALIPPGI